MRQRRHREHLSCEQIDRSGSSYGAHVAFASNQVLNLFSHNSKIDPQSGYNEEKMKVVREAQKMFWGPCVRVPVLRAHCIAINFECERSITPAEVRESMARAPGVRLVDDSERNYFPMPKDASGQDAVLVGRIRQDLSDPSGRSMAIFVAGDQLLKGAALNAVQIAELLQEY